MALADESATPHGATTASASDGALRQLQWDCDARATSTWARSLASPTHGCLRSPRRAESGTKLFDLGEDIASLIDSVGVIAPTDSAYR